MSQQEIDNWIARATEKQSMLGKSIYRVCDNFWWLDFHNLEPAQ